MEISIWDSYAPTEISDKIKYWVDLWDDLIEDFNKTSHGLALLNPRILLHDIIDEITSNAFRNPENRKYFYSQVKILKARDPVLRKFFPVDFDLIRNAFNQEKGAYLLDICKVIEKKVFYDGKYFQKLHEMLEQILLEPEWKTDDQGNIQIISQYLIIELIGKGYSLDEVKEFPRELFAKCREIDGRICTRYPHGISEAQFLKGQDIDEAAFDAAVEEKVNKLTVLDRLHQLLQYYSPEIIEGHYIFKIEGLLGDGIDFCIGDVNFYSPGTKRYIKGPPGFLSSTEFKEDQYNLNAAVFVRGVSYDHLRSRAIDTVEKALNLLRCHLGSGVKFEIGGGEAAVDANGSLLRLGGGKGRERENAVNFDHLSVDKLVSEPLRKERGRSLLRPLEDQNDLQRKISNALYWYRKGEEARTPEDKLLSYWVILETLLEAGSFFSARPSSDDQRKTPYLLSKEFVPPIQGLNYIFTIGWELFHYLGKFVNAWQEDRVLNKRRRLLELPEELIQSSGLDVRTRSTIKLRDLIDNLQSLADAVDRVIIKEKILFVKKFYNDPRFALEKIKTHIEQIQGDLLLIYRYRNKIVHNAHFDNEILPHYVRKIRKYAGDVLRRVLKGYSDGKVEAVGEVLVGDYVRMEQLLKELEKGKIVDWLNLADE